MTKYKLTMTWSDGTDVPIDPQFCPSGANEYPEGSDLMQVVKDFNAKIEGGEVHAETLGFDGIQLEDRYVVRIPACAGDYAQYEFEEIEAERQGCDQCSACMVMGVFCHETGCPNENSRWSAEESRWIAQRTCFECGCEVDADSMCCDDEQEVLDYLHLEGLDFDDCDDEMDMVVGL